MRKILVSDYDQTFYLNDEDIEKNKKSVENFRKHENIFIFATGRSYFDFMNKAERYKLKWDYLIINHGATILDKNNNIISNYTIDNNIIKNIEKDLEIKKSINHFCCKLENSRTDFNDKDLTKIYAKYEKDKAEQINSLINKKYSEFVNCYLVSGNAVEIISNKTCKSNAIEEIVQIEKVNRENIFTIGDGYSDIEMIKNYNGYCMEKSVQELLKICNGKIVKSVSELIEEI
jgi:HAD superfamily hydrolase (TIGR01484 family)